MDANTQQNADPSRSEKSIPDYQKIKTKRPEKPGCLIMATFAMVPISAYWVWATIFLIRVQSMKHALLYLLMNGAAIWLCIAQRRYFNSISGRILLVAAVLLALAVLTSVLILSPVLGR